MIKKQKRLIQLGIGCSILFLYACSDLSVRDTGTASFVGSTLKLEGTVHNQGERAAEASVASFEMQMDATGPYTTLGTQSIPPLAVGQEIEVFIPFNEYWVINQGECRNVRVCSDSTDAINEGIFGGESNNCQVEAVCR